MADDEAERFTEQVLSLVESIPSGRVMSYGAIAAAIGHGGPRQVAQVMARDGGAVPWWRVVHADGSPYAPETAVEAYARERTPLRGADRIVVDMPHAAWIPPRTTPGNG
ncbi:MAG TPA: MGMT family protein [Nocardioidaceae bacterium]|nr:MGMT family protein [Nocardioidaceae bacterium]